MKLFNGFDLRKSYCGRIQKKKEDIRASYNWIQPEYNGRKLVGDSTFCVE